MFLKPVSKRTSFRNPFECYYEFMTVLKVQNRKKNTSYITSVDLHTKKGLSLSFDTVWIAYTIQKRF
jgi:hypothetical protein